MPDPIEKLAEAVRWFVANKGYNVASNEVMEVVKGDPSLIPQNIYALILAHRYDKECVAILMAKGAEMLNAQMTRNRTAESSNGIADRVLKEVRVEDVQKFRDTLVVGEKRLPVQPQETFYYLV
jgi:uncharacterized protein (UPF0297 family)